MKKGHVGGIFYSENIDSEFHQTPCQELKLPQFWLTQN